MFLLSDAVQSRAAPTPILAVFSPPSSIDSLVLLVTLAVACGTRCRFGFCALAAVDTTVASNGAEEETETKMETDAEMAAEAEADAAWWPNEKSQRRARNCSACP
ncbi:hypothetical protein ACLKA6_009445 [Drosophila palustris]